MHAWLVQGWVRLTGGPREAQACLACLNGLQCKFFINIFFKWTGFEKTNFSFFFLNFAEILMTVRRLSLIRVSLCVYSRKAAFCVDTYEQNYIFTETCTNLFPTYMDTSSTPHAHALKGSRQWESRGIWNVSNCPNLARTAAIEVRFSLNFSFPFLPQ
jgi:hypothetical protein